ncbi:MAG: fumarylacetoacetase [Vulcanimicrobiaceae bacterium]
MLSWRTIDERSDFPLENLPYGAFRSQGGAVHLGVAIGKDILDLAAVAQAGLIDDVCERELLEAGALNPFLAAGRATWVALRERLTSLLTHGGDPRIRTANADRFFVRARDVELVLPVEIGDYVDFYSSIEHATNLGRIFRPDAEPLMPNWRHLPIGYHGRSSTIVIDGTPIVRPCGQRKAPNAPAPEFGPASRLDIELEIGFIAGPGNSLGDPIGVSDAREHIFGLVLVNDWSARDIQAWEYQPLGPFLGKSFATTISGWIVTLEALEPFRVRGPRQEPEPLPYLRTQEDWAYDIALAVDLQSAGMREQGLAPQVISRTTFAQMYWNMAQQLAYVTSNGTAIRPGDLYASGTISGVTPESLGSCIELSWNGERPIELPNGERRTFLADGDEVTLRGWCERPGVRRIGFGQARGTIVPAR